MLDHIDSINWASLEHAYGSAVDVPDLLRALTSPDKVRRNNATHELFGNIWHQGTVYSATAAAVPFLYELLNNPEIHNKANIAGLLACIADGGGYLEIHAVDDIGKKTWQKVFAVKGKLLEEEMRNEANVVRRVREAVATHLLDLLPYLNDSEPENRRAVAKALGGYPEFKHTTLPQLHEIVSIETDEEVQQAIVDSIHRLEFSLE